MSNITSVLQQSLYKWLKVLHSCLKSVASFNFATGTLRAYAHAVKSFVIIVISSFHGTSTVGTTSSAFSISLVNSDFVDFNSSLGRVQCLLIHNLIAQQHNSLSVWHSRCWEWLR